jgi:hypothetical protein
MTKLFYALPRYKNLKGNLYGRLRPVRYIGTKHDCANWLCICYCGNICEATSGELNRKRNSKISCGHCYDHLKYPSEWLTWRNMLLRCYDSKNKDYKNYGARGITVCNRWRCDFLYFLEDMGLKAHPNLTIDRKDNNGNYEPSNCQWVTRLINNLNKRNVFKCLN